MTWRMYSLANCPECRGSGFVCTHEVRGESVAMGVEQCKCTRITLIPEPPETVPTHSEGDE